MRRILVLGTVAALALTLFALPAVASGGNAKITVVHGIPGDALGLPKELPVDICLEVGDPTALLQSVPFKGNNAASPIQVPTGEYPISVRLDSDPTAACEGDAVLEADLAVVGGKSLVAIAHLTEGLQPGAADTLGLGIDLSVFEQNTSRIGLLGARLTVGHFADAPAVDVWQGLFKGFDNRLMRPLFTDVTNGIVADRDFLFGKRWIGLAISPSSRPSDIAVGPVQIPLPYRTSTTVLAVGSLGAGSGSPFGLGSFDFITFRN